jgi:hypothetical protein
MRFRAVPRLAVGEGGGQDPRFSRAASIRARVGCAHDPFQTHLVEYASVPFNLSPFNFPTSRFPSKWDMLQEARL